jgi:hypothetical protein
MVIFINSEAKDSSKSNAMERRVLVQVLDGSIDADLIDLLFSSKEKSGGGPIQHLEVSSDSQTAVISFQKKEGTSNQITVLQRFDCSLFSIFIDAEEVLARKKIVMGNTTYQIHRPVALNESSRMIRLSNLPSSLSPDALELILEMHLGRFFSEAPQIRIDSMKGEAIVILHESSGNTDIINPKRSIHIIHIFQTLKNFRNKKSSCIGVFQLMWRKS